MVHDPIGPRDGPVGMRAFEQLHRAPRGDRSLPDDAEVPPGAAGLDDPTRKLDDPPAAAHLPSRLTGLRDPDDGVADRPAVADAESSLGHPGDREVLAEGAE